MIYDYEDALKQSIEYFGGDDLSAKVFVDKYALRDHDGNILENTPDKMHRRLAKEFARIEKKYENPMSEDEIFNLIDKFEYIIPQGSPMSAIGNPYHIQSSGNCFAIEPPYDSYGGIFYTDQQLGQLMKRRCGVGCGLNNLRPKGEPVHNAAKTTDGIGVFMHRFSNTCREVAQNGRRGALILLLSVHHPEIRTFMNIKMDKSKVTGANISIQATDEFLNAVEKGEDFELRWPVDSKKPVISQIVSAKEIWDNFIDSSWSCVDYNTEIDIYKNNSLIKYKIGDFYKEFNKKSNNNYEIMSLNMKSLKMEKKRILNSQEYFNNKETYKIRVGSSFLQVTEDHIFYKLGDNGDILPLPLKDLEVGDKIAFSKKGDFGNSNCVNLIDIFENLDIEGYTLEGESITSLLQNEEVKILLGKYSNGEYKTTTYLRCGYMPLKEYYKVKHITTLDINKTYLSLARKNVKIPIHFKIEEKLCAFLGLWLAEGSYNSQGSVRIHIHKKELIHYVDIFKYICDVFDCNYSCKYDGNYCCVEINSAFLKYFIMYIGMKKHLSIKSIPEFIFNMDKNNVASFLKGLFSGDGTVGKKRTISLSQSNLLIMEGVQKLLLKFNIHCNIILSEKKGKKYIKDKLCNIKDAYKLNIYHKFNNIYKKEIGFLQEDKQKRLIGDKEEDSFIFGIPVDLNRNFIIKEMGSYNREYVKQFSVQGHPNLKKDGNVDKFLNSDIYYLKINSKEKIEDINTVYDITVQDNHTFMLSNGIILSNSAEPGILFWDTIIKNSVSNDYGKINKSFYDTACNPCGEIVMGADSCRLLALNLYSFVENKFTDKAFFNFDKFSEYVRKAQRMMDDMVDLEIELIERILNKIQEDPEPENIKTIERGTWENILEVCKSGRRTGLGITGLADVIASLGVYYGSQESIQITEEIYRSLAINAYMSTCILAKERGAFPIFSFEIEKENNFINKVISQDEELEKLYKKYGRRNVALTTTPPAGSISLLARVSSGMEPVFTIEGTRRKKIHEGDKEIKIDFIDDMGDKWQEFKTCHKGFEDWVKITGKTKIEDSPYYKAVAKEIDWIASVDIQAAAQKWVCHSISKTCNLPQDVSKEVVENIYMRAWKKGCKGFTIYREGCRSGVILDSKESKIEDNSIIKTNAPKRPRKLKCDIFHISVKKIPFFIIVGILNKDPYEIFAGINVNSEGDIIIHKNFKEAFVEKEKRGKYSLIDSEDKPIIENISKFIDEEQEAITRLISSNLRHGCDVNFVVHQLEKTKGDLMSFSKAISRVLKKYIKEGSFVYGEECPECGGSLIRVEGCQTCSCGYSKCS